MRNICNNINQYWFHIFLLSIRQIIKKYPQKKQVLNYNKDELFNFSLNPKLRFFSITVIEMERTEIWNDKTIDLGLSLLQNSKEKISNQIFLDPKFIFLNDILDAQFKDYFIFEKINYTKYYAKATSIIENMSNYFKKINESIIYILPLKGDYNEIISGSSLDIIGLIGINFNCDKFVLAEQIIHEGTHNYLNIIVNTKSDVKRLIFNFPSALSIYSGKVRPFELLLHGYLSYASVYFYWTKILKIENLKSKSVKNRLEMLIKMLHDSLWTINNLVQDKKINMIDNFIKNYFYDIFELHSNLKKTLRNKRRLSVSGKNENYKTLLSLFSFNSEKVELILALIGNKISRFTYPVEEALVILKRLDDYKVNYCVSNEVYNSKKISESSFSQIYESIEDIRHNDSSNGEINIYIGKDKNQLLETHFLDLQDKAGDNFDIPKCCQNFFSKSWSDAVKDTEGDLFLFLLKDIGKKDIEVPWQLNVLSLYRGNSYIFHFPCSINCNKSIRIVEKRYKKIKSIDYNLAQSVKNEHLKGGSFLNFNIKIF